jgi:hypothetical protein
VLVHRCLAKCLDWVQQHARLGIFIPEMAGMCANAGAPASNATYFCTFTTNNCYWYSATQTNQATAQTFCRGLGGHLVSFSNHDEQVRGSVAS